MPTKDFEELKEKVLDKVRNMPDGDWTTVAILTNECGCDSCTDKVLLDLCQAIYEMTEKEGITLEFEENEYSPITLPFMQTFIVHK